MTAPVTVTFPAAPPSRARSLAPVAIVELNRIAPPVESTSTLPVSVTALVNVTSSAVVSTSPAVLRLPPRAAPKATAPPASMSPAAATVVVPVASISTVPLTVMPALMPIVEPAS